MLTVFLFFYFVIFTPRWNWLSYIFTSVSYREKWRIKIWGWWYSFLLTKNNHFLSITQCEQAFWFCSLSLPCSPCSSNALERRKSTDGDFMLLLLAISLLHNFFSIYFFFELIIYLSIEPIHPSELSVHDQNVSLPLVYLSVFMPLVGKTFTGRDGWTATPPSRRVYCKLCIYFNKVMHFCSHQQRFLGP